MDDDDLVQTEVDGILPSLYTFLSGVNACENHPNFERLWHNFLQEEGRINSRSNPSNEENLSLAAKMKKVTGNKFPFKNNKGKNIRENESYLLHHKSDASVV